MHIVQSRLRPRSQVDQRHIKHFAKREQCVERRRALPELQDRDIGAIKPGLEPELFLGEAFLLAQFAESLSEGLIMLADAAFPASTHDKGRDSQRFRL